MIERATRRDVLKLAGGAALGVAGAAALGASKVRAAGSGTTIGPYFNPVHVASGHLAPNSEVVIGPFPYPVPPGTPLTGFDSADYSGMIGNLTATNWRGSGWLAARSTDDAYDPGHQALNLNFGGHFRAWSNAFVTKFGFTGTAAGKASTGQFILRSGPAATDYVVDILGFLGPDQ